ncbi:sensor histidine kinase [Neomoorella humiferrea]|uniref:histidine kinase n=1 Tax=Neomoorella humiferrea TaxID=676965 RepID=A0A2T0AY08_9FIRM|nr:sensor histidine kinase KdpD [Moorella humiferrea]PRR75774.1 Sensor protein KdpD [Moorella humiferrea]
MERDDEIRRPDPEDLLAQVKAENRGRLTIFLGAAAGVGKTYAMLETAHERQADGVDVVIGWVETHGRPETEALVRGLSIIPPRELVYRGKVFREMDLDALLQRRPQLALVDELAHTNIPGSRHTRRYQDVEELLAAGINVYTTLNIQHVESLNDIVAQITGIRVQETVPDRLLEEADQIQLIDIPPEELIERLKEGKVYVPPQAERALQKFFRPGNINALRELAMRYTARRVEGQLDHYMRLHGIAGPWPAGERVMACVSPSPFSAQVIRTARRMAAGLKAEWLAVYVETPDRLPADENRRDQLARNLHLAEELGAEVITLTGNDAAEELLAVARRKNVTQIVIGKPLHPRWQELWRGSLVDKIIRGSQGISVHIIPGRTSSREGHRAIGWRYRQRVSSWPYAGVLVAVMLVTVLNKILQPVFDFTNIALLYLLPVLFSASRWGRGPSILASVLGALAFDFFFVPPVLSFTVYNLRYLLSFVIFLVVAVITSTMATRLNIQVENARRRETRTAALYALSRKMAAETDIEGILKTVVKTVAETVDGEAVIFMPDAAGKLEVRATVPSSPEKWLDNNEYAVAGWVFTHEQIAGRGTDTLAGADGLYLPLKADENNLGVLGVKLTHPERHLEPEQRRLLEAFASLAALAILRLQLAAEAQQARYLEASEKLRTALFNSISHELRTPLASITAAVTGLLEGDEVYHPEERQALLQTIKESARRLNRLVGNLLDMARLESGMLQLKLEWCDLEDIIGVALGQLRETLQDRPLEVSISPGLPLVKVDFTLIEQVLVNLLENAVKYSPPGSKIDIAVRREGKELQVAVADRGVGIPESDRERVFGKFYRLQSPRHVSGTGLGLSICKGIIEAHGGKIWVEARSGGGSVFYFSLPLAEQPPGAVPSEGGGGQGDR